MEIPTAKTVVPVATVSNMATAEPEEMGGSAQDLEGVAERAAISEELGVVAAMASMVEGKVEAGTLAAGMEAMRLPRLACRNPLAEGPKTEVLEEIRGSMATEEMGEMAKGLEMAAMVATPATLWMKVVEATGAMADLTAATEGMAATVAIAISEMAATVETVATEETEVTAATVPEMEMGATGVMPMSVVAMAATADRAAGVRAEMGATAATQNTAVAEMEAMEATATTKGEMAALVETIFPQQATEGWVERAEIAPAMELVALGVMEEVAPRRVELGVPGEMAGTAAPWVAMEAPGELGESPFTVQEEMAVRVEQPRLKAHKAGPEDRGVKVLLEEERVAMAALA